MERTIKTSSWVSILSSITCQNRSFSAFKESDRFLRSFSLLSGDLHLDQAAFAIGRVKDSAWTFPALLALTALILRWIGALPSAFVYLQDGPEPVPLVSWLLSSFLRRVKLKRTSHRFSCSLIPKSTDIVKSNKPTATESNQKATLYFRSKTFAGRFLFQNALSWLHCFFSVHARIGTKEARQASLNPD